MVFSGDKFNRLAIRSGILNNNINITKNHKPKMSKQPQGQQMFEIGDDKHQPQIGTEILDPTMPSDLDFDDTKKQKQYEGSQINENIKQSKNKMKISVEDEIKSYTIKGKCKFEKQPKYKCASYLKGHIDSFEVKAFDEEKSGGMMKSIWESLVGYSKREILIEEGYIYVFEKTKDGYLTHSAFKLTELFKIFVDFEESKIRLVFQVDREHLQNKNFQVKSCQEIVQKIIEEVSKIGLIVFTQ